MKLNKKLITVLIGILIVATVSISFGYSYYSEVFRGAYDATTRWNSPTRNSSGYSTWVEINSKWSEPRTTGTSPHVGIDIPLVYGTKIYAVMPGTVTKTNDQYNTLSQRYGYSYLYCHYEHMSSIIKTSGYAYTGDLLGYSGDYGVPGANHLHWGAYDENGLSGRKAYRNETFYRNASAWNYGRNVDVYSQCQWNSNTAKITAVFSAWDNDNDEIPAEVRIYHRKAGTSSWTDGGVMSRNGFDYTYDFSGKYSSGTSVEWLVRIKRNVGVSRPYAWAPSKYYNPDPNPNATSYRYAYFTNTVY